VLGYKIIYILLIIENPTGMPHRKIIICGTFTGGWVRLSWVGLGWVRLG